MCFFFPGPIRPITDIWNEGEPTMTSPVALNWFVILSALRLVLRALPCWFLKPEVTFFGTITLLMRLAGGEQQGLGLTEELRSLCKYLAGNRTEDKF